MKSSARVERRDLPDGGSARSAISSQLAGGPRTCRWLVFVSLPLVVTSCGGGDEHADNAAGFSGSPENAIREFFQTFERGEWERQWTALHPEQQKLIPREAFLRCAERGLELNVKDVKVVQAHEEETEIPGTGVTAASEAIVVKLTLEPRATDEATFAQGTCVNCATAPLPPTTGAYHLFRVDGRWRWVVADPEEYSQGNCP